jgi:hypothetical protein
MTIFSVYIINKAGGLIYQYDHSMPRPENEKTFSFPLELTLKVFDEKIVVAFGERDGIKGGCLQMVAKDTSANRFYSIARPVYCRNVKIKATYMYKVMEARTIQMVDRRFTFETVHTKTVHTKTSSSTKSASLLAAYLRCG